MPRPNLVRTQVNGFEGSPLDPRCTFENFLVGPSNRMAHAAAIQVAETVFAAERGFNPLFLHANVGLGKSHLLHAIAWEVQRRTPHAKVLYLTAERFRFQFVDAIKSQDAMAFKDRFRSIDILLIDDFEYMQGDKTEQEFEHIVNALIDGGRQVVVASARPPAQIERLNDRMRSRLSRGLVTEINPLDQELRLRILERRVTEKRGTDPLFEIPRQVLDLLADKLTENGRELEGAVNRLYAQWQLIASGRDAGNGRQHHARPALAAASRAASRSTTFCAPSRATSLCRSKISCRSAAIARWSGRVRSACTWPSS